jgi:hypothetical protein
MTGRLRAEPLPIPNLFLLIVSGEFILSLPGVVIAVVKTLKAILHGADLVLHENSEKLNGSIS